MDNEIVSEISENVKSIDIQNCETQEIIIVKATKDSEGKVSYENLPEEVEINIYHYTHEERWVNFTDVIMCLLTMHATLSGTDQIDGEEEATELPS